MCVQTKMRIKSLLYVKGIRYPDTFEKPGTHWSRNFVSWIENEASSLPYEGGRSLLIQIENLRFIHNQILKATRELRKIMTQPRYQDSYKLLMSIPGIGFLTAATFLLEAGTSQDSQATIIWHHLWVLSPIQDQQGKRILQSGSPHEATTVYEPCL